MPTFRPLPDKDFLVLDNSHLAKCITPRKKIQEKIYLVSQQTNDHPSITENNIKYQTKKNKGDANIPAATSLRNVMNLFISIGFLSGVTCFLRNITNANCIDINSLNNSLSDPILGDVPYTFINQNHSKNLLTEMNDNITNHINKKTKREANPYRYYYTENQEEKCKTDKLQMKCKKAHSDLLRKGRSFSRLIINTGKTSCFCPPPNKQVEIMSPDLRHHTKERDNRSNSFLKIGERHKRPFYIPIQKKIRQNQQDKSTEDITIKKLYDFSCAEESQNISFSSVLKNIGETLKKPLTQISNQVNIYYNYEVLHLGCPSKQDQEKLERFTQTIDHSLFSVIQLLPGSQTIAILQNIISPLLIAASEDIEGKGINIGLMNEATQNVNSIIQDIIRAKSIKTLNDLHAPANLVATEGETEIDKNIVSYKDKQFGVWVDERFYELFHTADGIPYIKKSGDISRVSYDKISEKWHKLQDGEEIIYSSDNIRNIDKYGIPFSDVEEPIKIDEIADPDQTVEIIHNRERVQCILTCGKLIPVEIHSVRGDKVFTTASAVLPKKMLSRNRFDWFFEQESASISKSLTSFIDENIKGEALTQDNLFTYINDDGFAYNEDGQKHLKLKDLYYPVSLHNEAKHEFIMRTKYGDEVIIIGNSLGFSFKWATVMPIGIDHEVCGTRRVFLNNKNRINIDKDAYAFLLSHGVTQEFDEENIEEVFGGVYTNQRDNYVFIVNDKAFSVSEYSAEDGSILIKSNIGSDIMLYLYHKLIIRKRDRIINGEYTQIKKCLSKRGSIGESCLPVFISQELKCKLDECVKKTTHVRISDTGLVRHQEIPGCFIKDNELYFYHEGFMFKAEASRFTFQGIGANTKKVKLYINSETRKENIIASFIIDIKNNRVELKEPNMYLAEKTGIMPDTYEFFSKNSKYYIIPNFSELDNAVNEVNKHGSLHIIDPPFNLRPTLDDKSIINLCRTTFFPSMFNPDFSILSLRAYPNRNLFQTMMLHTTCSIAS